MELSSLTLMSVVLAALLVLGGMLVQHAGITSGATRRQQIYLLLSGIVLALTLFILVQVQSRRNELGLSWLMHMIIPILTGVIALLILNVKNLSALTRRQKFFLGGLSLVLLLLVTLSSLPPFFFAIYIVPGVIALTLAWTLAARSRLWLGLFSLAGLVFIAVNTLSNFSPWRFIPQWLGYIYPVVVMASPPLIVGLSALGVHKALRSTFPEDQGEPGQNLAARWIRLVFRLLPIIILILGFAYLIYLASIWDHTSDGLAGVFFTQPAGITAVAAGMMLASQARGWKRLGGLIFAVLVPLVLTGSFNLGWGVSYHEITENRAARIQQALESYHARSGTYPASLDELTPRELLWLPRPVILRGQDWCYEGGTDYYQLGAVYREYFSLPLEERIYASAGQPPSKEWACTTLLAELKPLHDPPDYLSGEGWEVVSEPPAPASQLSISRQPVQPLLQSRVLAVGDWSPGGRFLALGVPRTGEGGSVLGLSVLDARSGALCTADEVFKESFSIADQHAWLGEERLLLLSSDGTLLVTPCSTGSEKLDSPEGDIFVKIEAVDQPRQRVLLRARDGTYWMLAPADLTFYRLPDISANPDEERSFKNAAISPDGQHLAVSRLNDAGQGDGHTLYILSGDGLQLLHSLPLPDTQGARLPMVEWLSNHELLLSGSSRALLVFVDESQVRYTDVFDQIFKLDIHYPNDISGWGSLTAGDGENFYLAVRLNLPRNQAVILYDSRSAQLRTFAPEDGLLLISGSGSIMSLHSLDNAPPGQDRYDVVWLDDPAREINTLVVEGHLPRSYPTLFPRYLPGTNQLAFASEQGVSLVSLPQGETIGFWELGERATSLQPVLYPSPDGSGLAAVIDFEGLYFIQLQP